MYRNQSSPQRNHGVSLFILIGIVLVSQTRSFAYIKGSPHDFSGIAMTGSNGEVCRVCHVPHNGRSTEVPLWRASLFPVITYTLYSSDTLDATVNQPMVPTKACLTCHDGSTARSPANGCSMCHTKNQLGTDLSNDHPVSFIYDTALAQKDSALRDPKNTPVSSLGDKTIRDGMLYQDRLECTSCHDVHATKGDSSDPQAHLLLVKNDQSHLCLTCHNK